MIEFPDKKYDIIYADPPWQYRQKGGPNGKRGMAEAHYPTMNMDELKALPVQPLASNTGCALFLWATCPQLPQAIELMHAWGFEYKTVAFAWAKYNRKNCELFWGMGAYTRANIELCLLGVTPGYRAKEHVVSHGVHQMIEAPVGRHSAKPPQARARIEALMGDVPRIELFARERAPGWDAWGDEV